MADTIQWPGASGKSYTYYIYAIGASLKAEAGNYIFARAESNTYVPIYIGETENLSERFDKHHKKDCIEAEGATHIHAHLNADEQARLAEESDLIAKWKPPCNG